MSLPDHEAAARFSDWAARQLPTKERVRRFFVQLFGMEDPHMSRKTDETGKPLDEPVVMLGDLPYPPRNSTNTFSPDPWKDVRGTPEPPPAGSILLEAQALVHGSRQRAYGHPAEDFSRTAALANVLLAGNLSRDLDARDVALFMVAVKLSREVNQHGRDNLVDAAGYLETLRMVEDFFATVNGGLHEDQA